MDRNPFEDDENPFAVSCFHRDFGLPFCCVTALFVGHDS